MSLRVASFRVYTDGSVWFASQGISDTPAWVVSAANTYAKDHGKTPFVIYEGSWSILDREIEREVLPMCRQFGLAISPWNVLYGGTIRIDEEENKRRQTGEAGKSNPTKCLLRERD